MGPADLDRLCPDWREREAYISGPERHARRVHRALGASTATCERLHMERFQPKLGLGDGERGRGRRRSSSCMSDCEAESDGSVPILVAGEEAGLDLPYGCREGICHTCVGELRSGQRPRPAQRQGLRRGGRGHPDLHQRARGPGRDRAVNQRRRGESNGDRHPQRPPDRTAASPIDEPENPLHRLTPEQIEEIGREFDELHEQVKADLGDRDAALHPLDDRAPAPAGADRPRSS